MPYFRLEITLEEPLTIGASATVNNELRSLDYLPAPALRGAFFEQLKLEGLGTQAEEWFGVDGPRWSPAWPSGCVPMPHCFHKAKRENGFGSPRGVWNSLSNAQRPKDYVEPPRQHWLRWGARRSQLSGQSVASEIGMHVSLHYSGQGARPGALFSRETVVPKDGTEDRRYEAWLAAERLPQGAAHIKHIAIGKRRTVNGRCSVAFGPAQNRPWEQGDLASNEAVLELLSPAFVPGSRGGWLRGLDSAYWSGVLGIGVSVKRAFSGFYPISGWSGKWKLPREQQLGIAAGSCWRLSAHQSVDLTTKLAGLCERGIGVRREEGFGWMALNPSWLTDTLEAPFAEDERGDTFRAQAHGPIAWPGLTDSTADRLRTLLEQARQFGQEQKLDENHSGPLHDLLVLNERHSPAIAAQFLKQRAARGNPGRWEDLEQLQLPNGRNEAAFFLDAIVTEIRSKRLRASR